MPADVPEAHGMGQMCVDISSATTFAGDAIVSLIRQNTGLTDLDVSNCRLGAHVCKDLASAIAANRSIQYLLLDGNPFGDGAGTGPSLLFSNQSPEF